MLTIELYNYFSDACSDNSAAASENDNADNLVNTQHESKLAASGSMMGSDDRSNSSDIFGFTKYVCNLF